MTYEEFEPEEPRGWSPLAVALIATLVLLLGLGGALFGINVANKNAAAGVTDPTPTTAPPSASASPSISPSATAPPPPSSPPVPVDTFALPDLSPLDFMAARAKVRELKLGWRLVFEGTAVDTGVRASDPPAGSQVKQGATVKIFVKGAAPLATVPSVVGKSCDEAAGLVVESGLYPTYPSGRSGKVVSQKPAADAPPTLHWNDEVQLTCAT